MSSVVVPFANNPSQSISAFSVKTTKTTTTAASATTSSNLASVTSAVNSALLSSSVQPSSVPNPSSSSASFNSASSSSFPSATTPSSTPTNAPDHHGLSKGALAGIIVGSVVGGLLLISLIICLFLRKRRSQSHRISYQNKTEKFTPYQSGTSEAYSMAANTMNQPSIAQAATPTTAATFSTGNTSAVPLTTTTNAVDPPQTPIIDDDFWNQPPLGTYGVISSYTQTLDDELYIQPGDRIQVYTEYDDGWCLGINLTRGGARGVLPQHCLDKDALFATSTNAVLS